jgi:Ca-activated chloride channel family protein
MIAYFKHIDFLHPYFFLLLLLIPAYMSWKYFKGKRSEQFLPVPGLDMIKPHNTWRSIIAPYLSVLSGIAFIFLVIAMARPQLTLKEEQVKAEGIDIMLAMDLSSSMLAQDFKPDRLTVSKVVASDFVDKREFDRIGLSVFAGESFTQCPLTTDHRVVKDFLANLNCGILEDGTAIGMGLASGVNRLKESIAKSKVVILLTDGVNNAGYIKPLTAAEIAREIGVRVYTIGVGSTGDAISPVRRRRDGSYVFGVARVEIDEDLLTEIANMTGGKYFRATTAEGLEQIYQEIDRLEKTEMDIKVMRRYSEEFRSFLWIALILLGLEIVLRFSILRTIP